MLRSLEAELTNMTEDMSMYAENLTMKDDIVKSMMGQLAELQDTSEQSSLDDTTQRLTVIN